MRRKGREAEAEVEARIMRFKITPVRKVRKRVQNEAQKGGVRNGADHRRDEVDRVVVTRFHELWKKKRIERKEIEVEADRDQDLFAGDVPCLVLVLVPVLVLDPVLGTRKGIEREIEKEIEREIGTGIEIVRENGVAPVIPGDLVHVRVLEEGTADGTDDHHVHVITRLQHRCWVSLASVKTRARTLSRTSSVSMERSKR